MKTRHPTAGAAGHDASGGMLIGHQRPDDTQPDGAQQPRTHHVWRVKLVGSEPMVIIDPQGLDVDELEHLVTEKFGRAIDYARPAEAGHVRLRG